MNYDPQELKLFQRHTRWWVFYMAVFVIVHVVLSSVGAFFHFLLDHEISIVEGWLHKNGWELTLFSKVFSLFILQKFLQIRLYRPRSIKGFLKDQWRLPNQNLIVIVMFLFISIIFIGKPEVQTQNLTFFVYHFITYVSMIIWFMTDYFALVQLRDLFDPEEKSLSRWLFVIYFGTFLISFKMVIPDYFNTGLVIHLHFITMLFITESKFRQWSNAFFYLALFAAPLATLFGMDPVWGPDFSPFKFHRMPHSAFLITIWMLSLAYYRYRHRWHWLEKIS
jgi:hypothetical protein